VLKIRSACLRHVKYQERIALESAPTLVQTQTHLDMIDVSRRAGGPDALLPPDMARACEAAGTAKASRDAVTLFTLGLLAGAFIAFGALFMTVTATGSEVMPFGVARLLAGLVFSLGLILVVVGGAELFTGDVLMVMAFASRRITLNSLLRAWSLVYAGNIGGAIGTAALAFLAQHHGFGNGAVGKTALVIASAKAALPVSQLLFLDNPLQRTRLSCSLDDICGTQCDR
jgi:formate transporter